MDYKPGVTTHNTSAESPSERNFSWRFGEVTKKKERHNEHATADKGNTAENIGYADSGWPGTENSTHDTAHAVADELSKLHRHEKSTVAGLLSKTIFGAEVKKGCIRR